jgi:hypothetical protein
VANELTPAEVERAIQALTVAEQTNLGIEVTLPVAFGDGEQLSVVIESARDAFTVHDSGLSAMRLTSAGVSLSKHVAFRLNELARRYQCKFVDGRVATTSDAADVAIKATLVANAARAVADYVYEIRRQAEYDFRVIVHDRLREIVGERLRNAEEIVGQSGARYHIPIILDQAQARPQNFVSSIPNRSNVARSVSMFFDIQSLYSGVERDAVYDNEADVRKEDKNLLTTVGSRVLTIAEASLHFAQAAGRG